MKGYNGVAEGKNKAKEKDLIPLKRPFKRLLFGNCVVANFASVDRFFIIF